MQILPDMISPLSFPIYIVPILLLLLFVIAGVAGLTVLLIILLKKRTNAIKENKK